MLTGIISLVFVIEFFTLLISGFGVSILLFPLFLILNKFYKWVLVPPAKYIISLVHRENVLKSKDPRDILCAMSIQHLLRVDTEVNITKDYTFSPYEGKKCWYTIYSSNKVRIRQGEDIELVVGSQKFILNNKQASYVKPMLSLVHRLVQDKKANEKETAEQLRALDVIEKMFKS